MYTPQFERSLDALRQAFQEKDFSRALNLVAEIESQFPEEKTLLYYWRMVIHASQDDKELALQTFAQALKETHWYSDILLRKSPALKGLQNNPLFEQLVAQNEAVRNDDLDHDFPLIVLREAEACLSEETKCPLLVALHGEASNPQCMAPIWQGVAQNGWLVALPRAPQVMWKGAFGWEDYPRVEQELALHLRALEERFAVDMERFTWAGYGKGADLAIWLSLRGKVAAGSFLAINPVGLWMDDFQTWRDDLHAATSTVWRGIILYNPQETQVEKTSYEALADELLQAEVTCEIIETSINTWQASSEFAQLLNQCLNLIHTD